MAAIDLLSTWAKDRQDVEFCDQSSGLKHPGTIRRFSASDGLGDFVFVADSGAQAFISPMLWNVVEAETILGISSEAVHIAEFGRKYSIARRWKPQSDGEASTGAAGQLDSWSRLQTTKLYVGVEGAFFPALTFHGTVATIDDETYAVKDTHSGICIVISLKDAECELKKRGYHRMVQIFSRPKKYYVVISETDLSAADLDLRFFSRISSAIN